MPQPIVIPLSKIRTALTTLFFLSVFVAIVQKPSYRIDDWFVGAFALGMAIYSGYSLIIFATQPAIIVNENGITCHTSHYLRTAHSFFAWQDIVSISANHSFWLGDNLIITVKQAYNTVQSLTISTMFLPTTPKKLLAEIEREYRNHYHPTPPIQAA